MRDVTPIKTQRLQGSLEPIPDPGPTVAEQLDMLSAAVEAALDPDATPKSKADALKDVRERRKSDATVVKR